jgi:hypothetical protein
MSTSKTPDTQPAAMHEPDADVPSDGNVSIAGPIE